MICVSDDGALFITEHFEQITSDVTKLPTALIPSLFPVWVPSQLGEDTFNRAKLLNIGYMEALKDAEYDCFIFSDVDLIPMDDRNLYHCYDQPRHFAIAMDKFGFR